MFKHTVAYIALAGLLSAGVAFAEDKAKVEPGKGPTETMSKAVPTMTPPAAPAATATAPANSNSAAAINCTQAELTAMITKAGTLTDADKQKMTMGHLGLAKKSLDLKDMDGCTMHMKEAMATLGTVTK